MLNLAEYRQRPALLADWLARPCLPTGYPGPV